ncbi:aldo/keto reductase [Desulfovibrio sp. OttesenSCG-928-O18]|nr:aldo/keto reductase [Desulfovibrio sp. OttesenSCG-928-O18]
MHMIRLGRTNLEVTSSSFGALPIQRISFEDAGKILLRAVEGGINFFDTARAYSDSEEKMGAVLAPVRQKIIIASKTKGADAAEVAKDLETSLINLKTDYLDLLQIHNPPNLPLPGDGSGRYEAMVTAKEQGKIRFIGITSHSVDRALAAAESGLYDTVQYPFSLLSNDKEIALTKRCKELNVGFIAMKGLGGGLIRHIAATFAFMRAHENVVPIWGIQKMEELEEFLALEQNPPAWDAAMQKAAEDEKKALGKDFCRACGYCLPCPMDIPVPMVARMTLLLGRSPWQRQTTPAEQEKMARAETCIDCGECASRCPYGLDTPQLVRENYAFYKNFVAEKKAQGLL